MQTIALPCVFDATMIAGLPELQRLHPKDWQQILRRGARRRRFKRPPLITTWLQAGAGGLLLPAKRGTSWREQRSAAKRWAPYLEGIPIHRITERRLLAIVESRLEAEPTGSMSRFKRDSSFLRKWIVRAQRALRMAPLVASKWKRIPTGAKVRPFNMIYSLQTIQELMAVSPDEILPVQIGFALGCRLETAEIERLDFADFAADLSHFIVRTGSRRGSPRVACSRKVAMPQWLKDLILAVCGPVLPTDGPLFPHRDDPSRHCETSQERLHRVGQRLGRETATFRGIRELGQAIMRELNGSRASVRGTVPTTGHVLVPTAAEEVFESEQKILAEAWPLLMSPPVDPRRLRLPRRAPKGCSAEEPERAVARRRARERFPVAANERQRRRLPRSCLETQDPARLRELPGEPLKRRLAARIEQAAETVYQGEALTAERSARIAAEDRADRAEARAQTEHRQKLELVKATDNARLRRDKAAAETGALVFTSTALGIWAGTQLQQWMTRTDKT